MNTHEPPHNTDVVNFMLANDAFSKWLGLKLIELNPKEVKLQCQIRSEMLNGIGTLHGGVTFAMADSAFAFACNMANKRSVALDLSISYTKAGYAGDIFTITCKEIQSTRKTGLYEARIENQKQELIAFFKATCYRLDQSVIPNTQF